MTTILFLVWLGLTKCKKLIVSTCYVKIKCVCCDTVIDAESTVELNCIPAQQCLSTSIQYQCTVTDSNILNWRIRDENMTSLGTQAYTTSSDLVTTPAPFHNSLPFFTDYTSKSPSLISNISFTVQSSINGYTIHCDDGDGDMENCTIDITGM